MAKPEIMLGTLMDENIFFSFIEVCQSCHISEEVLLDWLSHGLLGDLPQPIQHTQFNALMFNRIQTAERLYRDLEMNIQGVILALELMDELKQLRAELEILKR